MNMVSAQVIIMYALTGTTEVQTERYSRISKAVHKAIRVSESTISYGEQTCTFTGTIRGELHDISELLHSELPQATMLDFEYHVDR